MGHIQAIANMWNYKKIKSYEKETMKLFKLFVVIGIFFFTSCMQKDNPSTTIAELIDKSPDLKNALANKPSNITLIRKVSFGQPNIDIQLFSQSEAIDDKQQIIEVTNNKKSYVIPFFSNTFQNYWHFEFDNLNPKTKQAHTTFEDELNNCLERLDLNDTLGTAGKVVNEILTSVLHCREIKLSDSSELHTIFMNDNLNLEDENSDSCSKRIKRNWEVITAELSKDIRYKSAYWDKLNERVYQFDFTKFRRKQANHFKVKTFRQDCAWHSITL